MQKKTAVALAVVVSVLAGCSFGTNRGTTVGSVNEPPPTSVALSPQTGFRCGNGPVSRGSMGTPFGTSCIRGGGHKLCGAGWLAPETGDYCVEEGGYVKFPNRPRIEGPKRGNSYTEQGKTPCYDERLNYGNIPCAHKRPGENLLLLSEGWFEGKCSDTAPTVVQLLAKHNISLEDSRWENCDIAGAWKGIYLSK